MMYVLIVLLCLAWVIRGVEQAILWSRQGSTSFSWNEHLLFIVSRGLLIAILVCATFVDWFTAASVAGVAILWFPFFHNGSYYLGRMMISGGSVYPDGWVSEPSGDSTAHLNFSWKTRYVLLIGGGILLIFMIIAL